MSIPKWFWVYIKNWACLKNLSMLETNFEEADGQGICNGFSEDLPKLGLLNDHYSGQFLSKLRYSTLS